MNYNNAKAYVRRHAELAQVRTQWYHSLPNNVNKNQLLNEYNRTIYARLMQNFTNLHNALRVIQQHEAAVKIQKRYRGHKARSNHVPYKHVLVSSPDPENNVMLGKRRWGKTPKRLSYQR